VIKRSPVAPAKLFQQQRHRLWLKLGSCLHQIGLYPDGLHEDYTPDPQNDFSSRNDSR
jgi:hypothetical protein